MDATFLLHKPVIYGSALANTIFLAILVVHIIAAVMAPIAGWLAFAARKGGLIHQRSGRYFSAAMITLTFSGIVLDVVRLSFYVEENHTKYAGYTMPTTYPARLGFIFAGLCVLYLLQETQSPQASKSHPSGVISDVKLALLVMTGLLLTSIIILRLNPWSGALWIIWTFILVLVLVGKESRQRSGGAIAKHRIGMSALAGFSWWGAFQGFIPAIAILIMGDDLSVTPYVGNQPGPFSPIFFLFFLFWAPFFLLAADPWTLLKKAQARKRRWLD